MICHLNVEELFEAFDPLPVNFKLQGHIRLFKELLLCCEDEEMSGANHILCPEALISIHLSIRLISQIS